MGPERRKVTFGRDLEADFTVRTPGVAGARHHRAPARALRAGRPQRQRHLRQLDGQPETRVHHEDLLLSGEGSISLGQPLDPTLPFVRYRCSGG
jgi:adenylate cyclase